MTDLIRPIREAPPVAPEPQAIKRLLKEYGVKRASAARICGVTEPHFNRYCLPRTSAWHKEIPLLRWNELVRRVQELAK